MTWLDWSLLILLAVFTVRGILRGTIAQVFAFLGLAAGAWALALVAAWVGHHWAGADPAVVFVTLRWIVAILAGLALAAVFDWWGNLLAKAAHDGPFGWIDRAVGGALGAATGIVLAALLALLVLQGPVYAATGGVGSRSVAAGALVRGGAAVTQLLRGRVPLGSWLHRQFLQATRRLEGRADPARVAIGH